MASDRNPALIGAPHACADSDEELISEIHLELSNVSHNVESLLLDPRSHRPKPVELLGTGTYMSSVGDEHHKGSSRAVGGTSWSH